MKMHTVRSFAQLLPIAALLVASGLLQAAEAPRVMFVSGLDVKPVIIDLQGKELPAKKGMIIKPGFSVKVPEGATVQIMTDEKAIIAVRPNSLLKLEMLGEGTQAHRFKLDLGGLRVANSDKKPHKFEVDTPNAKVKFDKGDHEAYYLKEGKLKDGRWGTFVRGLKDELVLSTKEGDTKITRRDVGYVKGGTEKTELIPRINVAGKTTGDPINSLPGASAIGLSQIYENQAILGENAAAPLPLPTVKSYVPPTEIVPPRIIVPIAPVAGLDPRVPISIAPLTLATPLNSTLVRPLSTEIILAKEPSGTITPVALTSQGSLIVNDPIVIVSPQTTTTISGTKVETISTQDISKTLLCLRSC